MAAAIEKNGVSLDEFLPRSPVIELPAKSLIFSSKKEKISCEKYLKRTIRSQKILVACKFLTEKNPDVFNFRQSLKSKAS